jgi:hypothetical protein
MTDPVSDCLTLAALGAAAHRPDQCPLTECCGLPVECRRTLVEGGW